MARRTRRRYSRRRDKWSPNIVKIATTCIAPVGEFFIEEELAKNPAQSSSGISQKFTAKNFDISFTIEASNPGSLNYLEAITAYIMFVPQGFNLTSSSYAEHPEWILNYKYLGSPTSELTQTPNLIATQQYQPFKVKSRLSRKLNTGDRIVLYIQGSNGDEIERQFNIFGLVRWWSKAN